ncbi:MAG: hypothetical protein ACP5C4_03345 [Methanomicrobiales archaeon]
MTYLHDAIEVLEERICGSGCEDVPVRLTVDYDCTPCQYPRGVCLKAMLGGRSGTVVTTDPLRATTRVSFMYGAPLSQPNQRAAAAAIINAVTAFLSLSRRTRPCDPACHAACLEGLKEKVAGKSIWIAGEMPLLEREFAGTLAPSPADADIILAGGSALTGEAAMEAIDRYGKTVETIFLGPSGAGVSALLGYDHHCPHGR